MVVEANRLRCGGVALLGCMLCGACSPVQQVGSVATAGSAFIGSMTAPAERPVGPAELRLLQVREMSASRASAFAAVITVLLDLGYRVQSADLESGLITAVAPSSGRLRLDPAGVARATQTPVASAFIEESAPSVSRVRVNFSIGTASTGQLASSGERPVLDGAVYDAFFAHLESELKARRQTAERADAASASVEAPTGTSGRPARLEAAGNDREAANLDRDEPAHGDYLGAEHRDFR
jgi:hypothetical protein